MPPQVATIVYTGLILGLFLLDRNRNAHTSKAVWIPVAWLLINGSRPVSAWLQVGPVMDSPEKYLDGSPLDAAVFAVLLGAGLVVLAGPRRRQVLTILRANLPIVLFFAYCALSILWSDYSFVACKRWIKATGDLVMVLVVLTETVPSLAIQRLLTRVAFVLMPASALLIKYYPDLGRSYNVWSWKPEYSGVTTGKNGLGMICLVFGLASLWRFLSSYHEPNGKKRTQRLIVHGGIITTAAWLLLTANSMTSLSCFALAGGLMMVTNVVRQARRPVVMHLLVLLVVCVAVSTLFFNFGGGALEAMGRDSSLTGRTEIWDIVLRLVHNPLIGTGFESFWLGDRLQTVWDEYVGTQIQEAHNGYIELYLNLGWIGVILLATLIVTGYRTVMTTFRRDPDIGGLRLGYFVAAIIYSLTEAGFRMMSPIWFAFILSTTALPVAAAQKTLFGVVPRHANDHLDLSPDPSRREMLNR